MDKRAIFYWVFTIILIVIFLTITVCKTGELSCPIFDFSLGDEIITENKCSQIATGSAMMGIDKNEAYEIACMEKCGNLDMNYISDKCDKDILICYCR